MIYKVSTTGTVSDVVLHDLGARTLTHPTVELDLGLEYTDDELIDSDDLAAAISDGELTLVEKSGGTVTDEELQTAVSGTIDYIDTVSGTITESWLSKDLVVTQIRRSTTYIPGTTWEDITFDTLDIEIDPDVVEWDTTNTDRILIKSDGVYEITYNFACRTVTTTTELYSRVMKNDTDQLDGSYCLQDLYQNETHQQARVFKVELEAGDFITLQIDSEATNHTVQEYAMLAVLKLDGVPGEAGPQGLPGADGADGVLTISGTADYFYGYDSAGTTQLNTSYTDIPLTEGYATDAFSHSAAEVTIESDNTYVIIGRFTVAQPTTTSRSEAQMRLVVDTGGGYTEIPGTIGVCYSRNATQGKSTATAQAVLDLNNGDKVKLQAQENSGGTMFGEQNGSSLMLFTTKGQVGPQGPKGDQGDAGADGVDGTDGVDGIDAGGTLAVVQARRTSAYTLTTTYTNITFDTTDEEEDTNQIEHNNINTDRIDIKDGGVFLIMYDFSIDASDSTADVTYIEAQVLSNDTDVLSGSWSRTTTFNETSLDGNPLFHNHLSNNFLITLDTDDYITLQLKYSGDVADTAANGTFKIVKLVGARGADGTDGTDGAPGPPGSGSTIVIQDEGSYTDNNPHSIINFTGSGVTASSTTSGTVDVAVSNSITIQDESTNITNTPHHTINFTGAPVSAYDLGGGVAGVWIQPPTFGTWYAWDGDETETNTNSVTPVEKASLTVTGVPAGYYRIAWYYEWRRNTTSNDYMANIVVDGTTTLMEHRQENRDVNSWNNVSGFQTISLTSGNHTIRFYHYGDSTGSTSYTRRARLEIWRVS